MTPTAVFTAALAAGVIGVAVGYLAGRVSTWRLYATEAPHLRIRPLGLTRDWDSDSDDEPGEEWSARGMRLTRLQRMEWNNGVAG